MLILFVLVITNLLLLARQTNENHEMLCCHWFFLIQFAISCFRVHTNYKSFFIYKKNILLNKSLFLFFKEIISFSSNQKSQCPGREIYTKMRQKYETHKQNNIFLLNEKCSIMYTSTSKSYIIVHQFSLFKLL